MPSVREKGHPIVEWWLKHTLAFGPACLECVGVHKAGTGVRPPLFASRAMRPCPSEAPCAERRRGGFARRSASRFRRYGATSAAYSAGSPSREGKGTVAVERAPGFFGQARKHRRTERPRQNGVDANAVAGEIARDGQGHGRDAALGSGIGDLADLPVLGGDGGVQTMTPRSPSGVMGSSVTIEDAADGESCGRCPRD